MKPWFDEHFGPAFMLNRNKAMSILQEENELNEIVQLVGKEYPLIGDVTATPLPPLLPENAS